MKSFGLSGFTCGEVVALANPNATVWVVEASILDP